VETSPRQRRFFGFQEAPQDFPDLVFGNDATNSNEEGVAIGQVPGERVRSIRRQCLEAT